MTLNEAIKIEENIAEENQRVVDTGIIFDDVTIDMLYCDDTEVIEEHLANYQRCAEEHRQLAEWLKELKHLREQESKIKVLDDMEAAKRLGMVDVYSASAWLEFIKDLKILGLRVCEVTESEDKE